MAFQEVAALEADVTVALGKVDKKTGKPYPKQAEGYYLGSREVENKRGKSQIHFLQTAKGNLGVWGTTDLNRKLAQAAPGTMVRITSTGTKATPNGDMYTYRVEQDKDNMIAVDFSSEAVSNGSEDYIDSSDDQTDSDEIDSLVASKEQARVEDLLKNRRTRN